MKVYAALVLGLHAWTHTAATAVDCNLSFKCLTNYAPVCGSDGKTYSNECVFENQVCQQKKASIVSSPPLAKLFDGPCDMANNPYCAIRCTKEYMPVCGSDGKTYSNNCMLLTAKCSWVTLYAVHDGECTPMPKPSLRQCNEACTKIYMPVCGSDGKTYGNECGMKVAACKKNKKITKKYDGKCKPQECNKACTKIYQPVCGSDGVTYSNACQMGVEGCKKNKKITKKYDGECKITECNDVCQEIYTPVCGSNNVTYSNQCELDAAACKANQTITKTRDGECFNTGSGACAAMLCAQYTECKVDEATGKGYCADVCVPERCAPDEVCTLEQVQCLVAPCSPIATCTKQ